MKVDSPNQQNPEITKNKISIDKKIITSNINTNDTTKNKIQENINTSKNNTNNTDYINMNKDQLYETFLLFHNFLSLKQNNAQKIDIKEIDDISSFNLGNESQNQRNIPNIQFYQQNNLKKNSKEISNDLKSLNYSKIKRKKYLNESFTLNNKNLSNEYSHDFSSNNLDTYSASIGDSIQVMAYDLLNNKNKKKLNSMNITCKTTKSRDNKNILNKINNKTNKSETKREISDYNNKAQNKENELIKNIKKIKVVKCKEEYKRDTNDNKNNKEQIIENKIKELNYETIKFREEKDKVIKIKKEYEKLHEKLIKDIEEFDIKKMNFEKYKEEEFNKIKEEKEKLLIERKELNNIKSETQTKKNNEEMINQLKNYISELKIIINKQENELRLLSQNNKINNYIINTYKTINTSDQNESKPNYFKTLRNQAKSKKLKEEIAKEFMPNLSCSKIKTKSFQNNCDKNTKSISLLNINDYSKIDKRKDSKKKDKISLTKINPNLKMNISTKTSNLKANMKTNLENKICTQREKKIITYHHKNLKRNNEIKNNITKRKDIKTSDKFSKTTNDFYQKNKEIKENKEKINNDNFEEELNKPLNPGEYDFIIPEKYSEKNYILIKKEKIDNKEVCIYSKNKKEIIFPSGIRKEIFNDGFQLIYFNNGDIKQSFKDGKNIYYYKEADTVQTSYSNGINIFKFSNGQIEKHFPNGLKKVFFPNGTVDYILNENNTENI